jgi:hypothetical protein
MDAETTMYPEVHSTKGATLRWSGVEEQPLQTPQKAHRNLLEPSHDRVVPRPLWDLWGGHRSRTSLGQSPQLNWRLPSNYHRAPHNTKELLGSTKEICSTKGTRFHKRKKVPQKENTDVLHTTRKRHAVTTKSHKE